MYLFSLFFRFVLVFFVPSIFLRFIFSGFLKVQSK
jgi:hypothetical protein